MINEVIELRIGPVAHGGHCVARLDGRVVFVRHTLPGELVRARVTDGEETSKLWRADAIEIIEASADRVPSRWPAAGADGVGGGELSHVSLDGQRRWKASVIEEQLTRLAGDTRSVTVEAAPGDDARDGLGWRTRIELIADAEGRAGMRKHRSHDVVPLDSMPLASAGMEELDLFGKRWSAGSKIQAVAPASGDRPLVLVDGEPTDHRANARTSVREQVTVGGVEREFRVAGNGFWQVHDRAPEVLVEAVLAAAEVEDGDEVWDLYSGSGLFSAFLAEHAGYVVAVEDDPRAVAGARRNLFDLPHIELVEGRVGREIGALNSKPDVIVLDPPRSGAGREVMDAITFEGPRRIVYVACDPAALARDVKFAAAAGYGLDSVRAFDLFPQTHHVECVAVLSKG